MVKAPLPNNSENDMTNVNAWPFPREKRIEPDVQTELKDALQQLAKAGQRVRELEIALDLMLERADEPPEKNCSCHLSPPCNDCVDYDGLREAFAEAREVMDKAGAA